MVPYEIDILIWYHSRCEDHEDIRRCPPVWRPTIERFLADGLLELRPQGRDMMYGPTDRLHAYVDALCNVPLPVQKWVMP